ncbi:MAG: FAD-dependent thymidylate synthase, partial [Chloroflexi bacterium]|nr:FAD-dependent thymidylate synthase [Chloroflexota bacterium]
LVETRKAQKRLSSRPTVAAGSPAREATLVHFDPLAEHKVAAAFLYRWARESYAEVWQRVQRMSDEERRGVVQEALGRLGPFDAPVREAEYAEYTFDLVLDYGAYREFKRHRMQSYVSQPLTVHLGYVTPPLIQEAGLQDVFDQAVAAAERAYHQIEEMDPVLAQYVATHAHQRRVLARMNLRECYHLLKLRTSPQTHFSLRMVMEKLLELCAEVHPALFSYLKRRTD